MSAAATPEVEVYDELEALWEGVPGCEPPSHQSGERPCSRVATHHARIHCEKRPTDLPPTYLVCDTYALSWLTAVQMGKKCRHCRGPVIECVTVTPI